jgi:hypothetical protein
MSYSTRFKLHEVDTYSMQWPDGKTAVFDAVVSDLAIDSEAPPIPLAVDFPAGPIGTEIRLTLNVRGPIAFQKNGSNLLHLAPWKMLARDTDLILPAESVPAKDPKQAGRMLTKIRAGFLAWLQQPSKKPFVIG